MTKAEFSGVNDWLYTATLVIYVLMAAVHAVVCALASKRIHYWCALAAVTLAMGTLYVGFNESDTRATQFLGLAEYATGYSLLIIYPAMRVFLPRVGTVSPLVIMATLIIVACDTVVTTEKPAWLFWVGFSIATVLHFSVYLFIYLYTTLRPRYRGILYLLFLMNIGSTSAMLILLSLDVTPSAGFLANAMVQALTSLFLSLPRATPDMSADTVEMDDMLSDDDIRSRDIRGRARRRGKIENGVY